MNNWKHMCVAAATLGGAIGLPATAVAAGDAAVDQPRPSILAKLAERTTLLSLAEAGQRLVAVGQRGHILLSDDQGETWRQVTAPHNEMLDRVRFRSASHGWAVGYDATIVATTDGGESWQLQHFDPEARPLFDVLFLDEQRGIAVGGYGTYLTTADGGSSWDVGEPSIAEVGAHFNTLRQLADGTLVMVGERGMMARSSDEGRSWEMLDSPYVGSLFGLLPYGDRGIMAFGMRGNVYVAEDISACRTIDPMDFDPFMAETVEDNAKLADMGWRHISTPTTEGLFGGRIHDGTAVLVGVNGEAVRVNAASGTVERLESGADESLNDAILVNGRWLAVGRRGIQNLGDL